MKSTLVETPDYGATGEFEAPSFSRASTVAELARETSLQDPALLSRVLLPGKKFGPYNILGFVAAGGMGEIYAAQRTMSDGKLSRPLALKVISAEYNNDWRVIERFKREARISQAIRSPHVPRVYEYGESEQGHVFMAMDLLNGEELFDLLHRKKHLKLEVLANITLQVLAGLAEIHSRGFVHRDIKPENIYLARRKSGRKIVKILDFGIAKSVEEKSDPILSVAGQIFGTPQYLAPEQAMNPDVDIRADIYSLGVVMYECASGSLPFDRETSYALILAHQNDPVPPLPSSIDHEFAEIIYKALAKDPAYRFQSAAEMAYVLNRWLEETSSVESDDEPPARNPNTPGSAFLMDDVSNAILADLSAELTAALPDIAEEDLSVTSSGRFKRLESTAAAESEPAPTRTTTPVPSFGAEPAIAPPPPEEHPMLRQAPQAEPSRMAHAITAGALLLILIAILWSAFF